MSSMEQLAKQEYERGYSDGKSDYFAAGVAEGEMRARQRMIANRVVANQHPFAASGKPIDHVANADKMVGCAYCNNPLFAGTKCNNCGRVTLAEPVKQEPVMDNERIFALREAERNGSEHNYFNARPHNDTPTLRGVFCQGFDRGFNKGLKYAAPVERQWVDLTDDEKFNLCMRIKLYEGIKYGFIDAVIAAFKEKNK